MDAAEDHYQKGWSFHEKNRLEEAAEEYRKALEIDPDFSLARSNLGMVYKLQKKMDDAIREWEETLSRGVDNTIVRMNTEDWLKEAKALREERSKIITDHDSAVKSYMEELGRASDKWFIAYDALARIGSPAVDSLIENLVSENDLLRNRSIDLLAKIGDNRAIEPLKKASKIKEQDFRSITKITGKGRTVDMGGMSIEISLVDMLKEYRNLTNNAVKQIKKKK